MTEELYTCKAAMEKVEKLEKAVVFLATVVDGIAWRTAGEEEKKHISIKHDIQWILGVKGKSQLTRA